MPLFEYACADGHRSEMLALFEQRPGFITCPTCGANAYLCWSVAHGSVLTVQKHSDISAAIQRARAAESRTRRQWR